MYLKENKNRGFTLIEVLVSLAIFISVSVAVYASFVSILKITRVIRIKGVMTNIANEQFEIVRNLSYQSVGTVNGIPSGIIPQSQTISRDNNNFLLETVIRNFDDPFDGTFNGTPKDSSPADMKLVELTISCSSCESTLSPISFTTRVAPKNLETSSNDGALVIKVFDASGLPISGAIVHIVNNNISPKVDLIDQTDNNGILNIVDAPPSNNGYQIIVTKDGYSSDQTYPITSGNPNPTKPNATVLLQQITQVSFVIDLISTINISTINSQCLAVPNFDFVISGKKLIGNPSVLKYNNSFITDSLGKKTLSNMEWDTYNITGTNSSYDIIGTNPLLSLGVNPNTTEDLQIITAPKNGNRLVVVVRDQSTGLPISDATVSIYNSGSYSKSAVTNEGYFNQTDWSGGNGQIDIGSANMYLNGDGYLDSNSSSGNLSLKKMSSYYASSGYLISSTFDTGSSSNFKQIVWNSLSQPSQTGSNSVRFQIATNNDKETWNFIGPDGTSSTYFDSTNQNIGVSHNGHRYIRYKIYLSTLDTSYTPLISDISITYTSGCTPPGQVSFSGLTAGSYTLKVDRDGYQSTTKVINVLSGWNKTEFTITP